MKRVLVIILLILISGCTNNNYYEKLKDEFQEIRYKNSTISSYAGYFEIDLDPEQKLEKTSVITLMMAGINLNEESRQYKVYSKICFASIEDIELFVIIKGHSMIVNEISNYELPENSSYTDIFGGKDFELNDITSISKSGYANGITIYTISIRDGVHNQYIQDFADIVYPEFGVDNVSFTDIQYLVTVDKEGYIRVTTVTFDFYCDLDDGYLQGKLMVKRTFDAINEINDLDEVSFYSSRDGEPDINN